MDKQRLAEIKAYVEDYCWDNAEQDKMANELVTSLEAAWAENDLLYEEITYLKERIEAAKRVIYSNQ